MSKPPPAPPSSDIGGVDEDELGNGDAAVAAGQNTRDLARARNQAVGKLAPGKVEGDSDDRSR